MREIRFRAWGRLEGKIYPVAFPSWNGCVEGKVDLVSHTVEYVPQDGDDTPVLMQYTGLTDWNGVGIYEGDILSREKNCLWAEGRHNSVVQFVDGCFVASVSGITLATIVKSFKPVVVGNIYEHPHLINPTTKEVN